MFVEVENNPNCEGSVFLRFKELGQARQITHVKTYDRNSRGEWCAVAGWCDDPHQPVCPAFAQKVEDSGTGISYLIFGGNCGIRFRPESSFENWNLESTEQWGEAYLSLSDERDIRYKDEKC